MSPKSDIKILLLGDIHGEINALSEIMFYASNIDYDIVMLVGDIGGPILGGGEYTKKSEKLYIATVKAVFETIRVCSQVPILFVPGNRDLPVIDVLENIYNIDLLTKNVPFNKIHGYTFAGVGGSNEIGVWPYEWDEEEIMSRLVNPLSQISDNLILLSHDAPFDTLLDQHRETRRHIGSTAVRKIINKFQPNLFICGHIHESVGCDIVGNTPCINGGNILLETEETLTFAPNFTSFKLTINRQFFTIDIKGSQIMSTRFFTQLSGKHAELYKEEFIFQEGKLFMKQCGKRESLTVTGFAKESRKK